MKTRRTIEILAILAMLAMGRSTHGAISVVNTGSKNVGTGTKVVTLSFDAGVTATKLVAIVVSESSNPSTVDVTFDGVPMVGAPAYPGTGTGIGIYYLDNPAVDSAKNLVVDFNTTAVVNGIAVGVVSISGANAGGPADSAYPGVSATGGWEATLDVTTAGSFVMAGYNNNTGSITMDAALTAVFNNGDFGSLGAAIGYENGVTFGSHTYTFLSANPRKVLAAAFAPPDTNAPAISSLSPADGSQVAVAATTNLVATFNENIQLTGSGSITITNTTSGGTTVIDLSGPDPDGSASTSGTDLTVALSNNLAYTTSYAVLISSNAVVDQATNYFAGITNTTTWNFTTEGPDTTPPTIFALSPADGATDVSLFSDLVATFDEDVALTGSGTIVVTNTDDNTGLIIDLTSPLGPDASVTVSASNLTVVLTNNFAVGKNYAVQISSNAVADLAGNPFAGITNNTDWNFFTVTEADGSWNGISGNWSDTTNPGGVWLNGIPADGSAYTANFTGVDIAANRTITVDTPRTIGTIIFTDDTTSSHDLTIDASGGSALTLAGSRTINVTRADRTLTISGEVAGTAGLIKSGAGTASLTASNALSGALTLNGGTLKLTDVNNGIGNITIQNGTTLLLDGATLANATTIATGSSDDNTIVLTNGASVSASGPYNFGRQGDRNTMTVVGGTATSTFNGGGQPLTLANARSSVDEYNQVLVDAGGVITNVSILTIGESSEYQTAHSRYNSVVVTNGGRAFLTSELRVGYCDPSGNNGGVSVGNFMVIANGSVVRANGRVLVGVVNLARDNSAGNNRDNSLSITSGGRLYSGISVAGTHYIGRTVSTKATAAANDNSVSVAGGLNGTNSMWDLGGNSLYLGFTDKTATGNVLSVSEGGVVTNIDVLTVAPTNTLELGSGGKIYASSATLAGTLNAGIDDSEPAGACGLLTVSGVLDVTGADLNIDAIGTPKGQAYVIASYGSMSGTFAATNGLMPDYEIDMNYRSLNQIAIVGPPAGTVLIIR